MEAITEIWTNSAHLIFERSFNGGKIFHKKQNTQGVICSITNTLCYKADQHYAQKYDVYMEMTISNKKLALITVYRPLKSTGSWQHCPVRRDSLSEQSEDTITIVDFNYPYADWRLLTEDQKDNRIVEMVEDSFLTQAVTQTTRENILLDLVLVSDPDVIRVCNLGEKLNGCDHYLIHFNVNMSLIRR